MCCSYSRYFSVGMWREDFFVSRPRVFTMGSSASRNSHHALVIWHGNEQKRAEEMAARIEHMAEEHRREIVKSQATLQRTEQKCATYLERWRVRFNNRALKRVVGNSILFLAFK